MEKVETKTAKMQAVILLSRQVDVLTASIEGPSSANLALRLLDALLRPAPEGVIEDTKVESALKRFYARVDREAVHED